MIQKSLINKVFSVFLGVILILGIGASLSGNTPFLTKTARAASQVTIGNKTLSVEFNKDYSGGDYTNVRGTDLDICLKTCAEDTQCKAYTYNPTGVNYDGNPVCWLKSSANTLSSVPSSLNVATGKVLDVSSNTTPTPDTYPEYDEYALEELLEYRECIQCYLEGANLAGKDLTGAYLVLSHLDRANLSGTDFTGAHLGEVDLTGANLEGAIVDGAFLYGAIMPDGSIFDPYEFERNNFGTVGYPYH
ncbi:MAG TPA: hypothetical protein DCF68_11365 [Cyanothece sp. UBA12306]|nr:hypothetical protein [Cyanothece sp. UBA12306]